MKDRANLSLRQSLETACDATNGDPNQMHNQRNDAVQATSTISENDGTLSSLSPSLRMACSCLAGTWRRAGCGGSGLMPNPIIVVMADEERVARGQ
jgi:hypothetical protein